VKHSDMTRWLTNFECEAFPSILIRHEVKLTSTTQDLQIYVHPATGEPHRFKLGTAWLLSSHCASFTHGVDAHEPVRQSAIS
jgi:hypothetical protein